MSDHAALIETLSRSALPVARPWPVTVRAAGLIAIALACGLLATSVLRTVSVDWSQPVSLLAGAEIFLSLALAARAIVAALAISIAGRSARLTGWYGAGVLAWLAANLLGIMLARHPFGGIGSGSYCFVFMMLAGLPMIAVAILHIRRTRALHPERALAIAGLGIAFLTSTLLGFCHPAIGNLLDFTVHLVAAVVIVGLTMLCGRRWVAI